MMNTLKPKYKAKERRVIRSELNIEKWSVLFATSKFRGKSRELYRRLDDSKTVGVVIGRQPDDRGNILEVGVLRIPDLKVFYGLIKLWESAGKPAHDPVRAGFRSLTRILGKAWGGKEYQQLRLALQRLRRIPIDWIGSFYQKDTETVEEYVSQVNILSVLDLYKREQGKALQAAGFAFKFHDRILRNLLNNHTKPLNLDVVLALKKELAILIYCHIDLVLADKERYERRTKELLADLAVEGSRYKYPAARKQKLEPALKDLCGVRLSTGILKEAFLQRTSDGKDWKAVFVKQPFELPAHPQKDLFEVQALTEEILAVTRDEKSRAFYIKIAKFVPTDLIYRVLSEVKEEWHEGLIRTTKGAVFTDKLKRYCQERGIDLGLKGGSP
jgi:hypothetical protein